jgi:hypothetical protein
MGRVDAYNGSSWEDCRQGSNLSTLINGTTGFSGTTVVSGEYYVSLTLLDFDTSTIPADATVTAVEFSLYTYSTSGNVTAHVQEVYAKDWGATITTADWVAPGDLGTLLASKSTSGFASGTRYTFVNESGMLAAIVKAGTTRFLVTTARQRNASAPTTAERISWYFVASGDPYKPTLVVTYSEAAPAFGHTSLVQFGRC